MRPSILMLSSAWLIAMAGAALPATVRAQTGVDDDRVSLPQGPGSLEGIGDDVQFDPNMGSMSHEISIDLPSGFPGATPSLSLSYSSAAGSGPLGIGWSMSTPVIGRMTSRGAPDYDTDDLFDADGAELVHVGTDAGDLIYRARFEGSFVRFRWVGAGAGAEGHWVAEGPDGSKSYFGADQDGNVVAAARKTRPQGGTAEYALVETVDPYGHSVRYDYASLNGTVPLLTGIAWLDGVYSVELDYEARADLLSDASRGFEEITADRVTRIRAMNGAETIREYVLTYESDASSGGFTRLARVEKYGVGGVAGGQLYPAVHTFGYSQALGVECTGADCDRPYLVDMGALPGAAGITNGLVTLIDINGDALPDVLDTSDSAGHRFAINTLTPDGAGGFTHGFATPAASAVQGTGAFQLGGTGLVQVFDVNGDGRSDLLSAGTGAWLENGGDGDWAARRTFGDIGGLNGLDFSTVKFIDIDDDKRVDLLTSTGQVTTLYHNDGDAFSTRSIGALGVAFGGTSNVQFADMNGDGLNDPVELRTDGSVRYRLNLGRGEWTSGAWRTISGLSISPTDVARADFEDLNGDGIADLVIVQDTRIQYAINRNGARFDPLVTIQSADITGDLPQRGPRVTVLFADMNANGSEDVVWFLEDGHVQYLELFPRRPNLMTSVTNGLGSVQQVAYTTAAQASAEARAAGQAWTRELQIPMQLVSRIDRWVTLTELHEVTTMTYRDGFYDGVEKQYRGFERIETTVAADEFQEEATTQYVFDVGRAAPHHKGKNLSTIVLSDGRTINVSTNTYGDCELTGVPAPATLIAEGKKGVYFTCETAMEVTHVEGLSAAASKTVRTEMSYDGYGNVTLSAALGVVGIDGDELYTETEYVTPSSRWLIGLPSRVRVYDAPGIADYSETLTYYDGDAFTGLPLGQATEGFVSRVTNKVDVAGATIDAVRARRDAHGNSVETIDPNGSIGDTTAHRRTYTYDDTGLFLITTDIAAGDHALRRESRYERNFQKVVEVTKWMLVKDGAVESNRDSESFRYDAFGRLEAELRVGDEAATPTVQYAYELADPVSRIHVRARSTQNGPLDEESFKCIDGKGREYQTRTRITSGSYQVSGFAAYNARGAVVQVWQPFLSSTGDCDFTVPSGVLSSTSKYDALGRGLESTAPGSAIYGEDLVSRTEHRPLVTLAYDAEDNSDGEHADTPVITTMDGLGRTLSIERTSMVGGQLVRSGDRLFYDSTGTFSGYENAEGHRHRLVTDLIGRTIRVENPNFGAIDYGYDDASNVVSITDARGVVQRRAYDAVNRIAERWDASDRDGTLVSWHYDVLPDGCERTECTNLPGQLAAVRYPIPLMDGVVEAGMDRFGYDVRRRSVFGGRRFGDLADLVTQKSYDNQDRVVSTTSPDGTTIVPRFDGMGRVIGIDGFVDDVGYDARNLLERLTFANGAEEQTSFDDLMRVARIRHVDGSASAIHDLTLTRNRASLVTEIADSAGASVDLSSAMKLDDWYRTTEVAYADASTETFELDALDRILSLDGVAQSYDSEQPLAVTAMGDLAMRYDAAGQLIARNGMALERDALGRIASITRDGEAFGAHAYGADDRVVQMTADGTLVLYGFDRFEVRDGVSATFVSVSGPQVALREGTAMATEVYGDPNGNLVVDAGDALLLATNGGALRPEHVLAAAANRLLLARETATTFLHADHLGSYVAATDEAGAVRGRQSFELHGTSRSREGYVSAYGFTGQEIDATTGLVHMKYRDLDPVTGRWDRFDPAFVTLGEGSMGKLGESSTGYAYVANNPANMIDPSGLGGFFGWGKKKQNSPVRKMSANKWRSKNFKPGMQIGGNAAQIHGKPGTYKERKAAYMKQKAHAANNAGPQPAAAVSLQQSASVPPPPPLPAPAQPAFQVDMNMLADFAFQMSNMMEVAKDMHIAQGGSMNQMVAPQTFGNAAQALFDANTRRAAEMVQRQAAQQSVFNAVPPPPPPPPSSAQMDRRLTTVIANDVDVDSL